jgi:hypothetical protein
MRSVTSGIASAIPSQGAFLGWLVAITAGTGQVIRLTSMDVNFAFASATFNAANLTVGGMTWDGTVNRPASITIGDPDLAYWALATEGALIDAPVSLWQAYAGASGEGAPLWTGNAGKCSRVGLSVTIDLPSAAAALQSPRLRVQQLVNSAFLIPGGSRLRLGGSTWTIGRQ